VRGCNVAKNKEKKDTMESKAKSLELTGTGNVSSIRSMLENPAAEVDPAQDGFVPEKPRVGKLKTDFLVSKNLENSNSTARGQCYKTFYGCKLRLFVIS